jgi:alpha-beta hydrolase superfamily lysophospholipase
MELAPLRRGTGRVLVAAAVLLALISLVFAWSVASKVIATPQPAITDATPGMYGLAFEEVAFKTADGLTLRGWLVPAQGQARAAIVAAHGRGGSRRSFLDEVPGWHAAGYCVLTYDTRGFARSEAAGPGDGFAGGWHDIVAAARFVKQHCSVHNVGVVGSSQGASNAIVAAARDTGISAVVAQGAGTNLYDVLRAVPTMKSFPDPLLGLITRIALLRMHAPWASITDLAHGTVSEVERIGPRALFLIHGSADATVPVLQAQTLYRRAREPKSLWIVPGGGHQGLRKLVGAEYETRVLRFLARYLMPNATPP